MQKIAIVSDISAVEECLSPNPTTNKLGRYSLIKKTCTFGGQTDIIFRDTYFHAQEVHRDGFKLNFSLTKYKNEVVLRSHCSSLSSRWLRKEIIQRFRAKIFIHVRID